LEMGKNPDAGQPQIHHARRPRPVPHRRRSRRSRENHPRLRTYRRHPGFATGLCMNTKARSGLLLCLLWLAGTGCSFHMTYLKPVEPPQFKSAAIRRDAHALVIFNEVIPGHPLPETIWDQSGPFWDAAHSHNIGFVQNYTDYIVALNIHSRQMIPFGRIFSDMITVATSNAFLRCDVAFSPQTAQSITNPPPDVQISINIDRFRVW